MLALFKIYDDFISQDGKRLAITLTYKTVKLSRTGLCCCAVDWTKDRKTSTWELTVRAASSGSSSALQWDGYWQPLIAARLG